MRLPTFTSVFVQPSLTRDSESRFNCPGSEEDMAKKKKKWRLIVGGAKSVRGSHFYSSKSAAKKAASRLKAKHGMLISAMFLGTEE